MRITRLLVGSGGRKSVGAWSVETWSGGAAGRMAVRPRLRPKQCESPICSVACLDTAPAPERGHSLFTTAPDFRNGLNQVGGRIRYRVLLRRGMSALRRRCRDAAQIRIRAPNDSPRFHANSLKQPTP